MEHIGGAGFEVKGIVRLVEHLFVFLHVEGQLAHHGFAFDAEGLYEVAYFLATANESLELADAEGVLLAGMDGQFYCCHVAL